MFSDSFFAQIDKNAWRATNKKEMIYNCQIDGRQKQEIKYSNQCSGN